MPTPTVYSSPETEWPLLQSKTEQKFKSGLFNVSAEFIRPVGNTSIPNKIKTSIGEVDVWPEPTVSVGTDGFERINATGYGVWDSSLSEATFGYEQGTITAKWVVTEKCNQSQGCTLESGVVEPCGSILSVTPQENTMNVIFETCHVKKTGEQVPGVPSRPESAGLRMLALNGVQDLNNYDFPLEFFSGLSNDQYSGTFLKKPVVTPILSSVNKISYDDKIFETEAVWSLSATVDFGSVQKITTCPPPPPPDNNG